MKKAKVIKYRPGMLKILPNWGTIGEVETLKQCAVAFGKIRKKLAFGERMAAYGQNNYGKTDSRFSNRSSKFSRHMKNLIEKYDDNTTNIIDEADFLKKLSAFLKYVETLKYNKVKTKETDPIKQKMNDDKKIFGLLFRNLSVVK